MRCRAGVLVDCTGRDVGLGGNGGNHGGNGDANGGGSGRGGGGSGDANGGGGGNGGSNGNGSRGVGDGGDGEAQRTSMGSCTPFTLRGLSWFGMEEKYGVPQGLEVVELDGLLDFVAASGFNALRVPLSVTFVLADPPAYMFGGKVAAAAAPARSAMPGRGLAAPHHA